MAIADGKLLTLDLILRVFGIDVKITGTVEALDVRRRVSRSVP